MQQLYVSGQEIHVAPLFWQNGFWDKGSPDRGERGPCPAPRIQERSQTGQDFRRFLPGLRSSGNRRGAQRRRWLITKVSPLAGVDCVVKS